jgi:hypothetical protein
MKYLSEKESDDKE